MTEAIYNNPKSLNALKLLVFHGFYKGIIESNFFELTYTLGKKSYPIKGVYHEEDNRFYLKVSFTQADKVLMTIAFSLFLIISALMISNDDYLFPTIFLFGLVMFWMQTKNLQKKSMVMFIDRFSQFYKS